MTINVGKYHNLMVMPYAQALDVLSGNTLS